MKSLLAYAELNDGDTDPGNNGPIQPSGGFPESSRKHAVGFLSQTTKSRVRLHSLTDLLLRVPPDATPEGARVCVYAGRGQNHSPLVDQKLKILIVVMNRVRYFTIDPSSAASLAPFIQAENTLGIEISASISPVPIKVSSRLRSPAQIKTRRRTKVRKTKAGARSRRARARSRRS